MWKPFAIAALGSFFGLGAPAAAQSCLSVGDGLGNAAVHCPDGRVGHLHAAPGGSVSGMLGGQPLAAPLDQIATPGLTVGAPPVGHFNPDISGRSAPPAPPPIAPPASGLVEPERPFSTYPDPEGAGMRMQPGEQ